MHSDPDGRQRHAGREDALAVLAFALAVELFPPLVDVLELRLVGAENLDLLAAFVQLVARCSMMWMQRFVFWEMW